MKILFLGDGYPVETDAGSILYLRLMDTYGVENFCYYGVGYKTKKKLEGIFRTIPKNQSTLRLWPNNRFTKYLKKVPWIEELFYFLLIPIVTNKVKKFAKKNNVDIIIAVLRADVLAVINRLYNDQKIPFLGYISDTVEAEFMDKNLIYAYKKKEYLKAIYNSQGVYVAGESMQYYIENSFGKKTSILRLGYEPNFTSTRKILNNINIFFSGSVYASIEFELFVRSLSLFANKHPDYNITLHTATKYVIKSDNNGFSVNNLGWMNEKDLIKIMQESHIGYIPYKFDSKYKMQMKYAFPSKAGFYLSTGLPLFFHGPGYSSVIKLLKKYQCGIHCSSFEEHDIVTQLETILFDKVFYNACIEESIKAFNKEFSLDIFKNNLKALIDSV